MNAAVLPPSATAAAPLRSPGYWRSVLGRFVRDPVAMGALAVVLVLVLVAGAWCRCW